jgi:hypothetical protein
LWDTRPQRALKGLEATKAGRRRAGMWGHSLPSPPRRGPRLAGLYPLRDEVADEVGVGPRSPAGGLQLARARPRARPPRTRPSTRRPPRWFGRATDLPRSSPPEAWPSSRSLLAFKLVGPSKSIFFDAHFATKDCALKSNILQWHRHWRDR